MSDCVSDGSGPVCIKGVSMPKPCLVSSLNTTFRPVPRKRNSPIYCFLQRFKLEAPGHASPFMAGHVCTRLLSHCDAKSF